MIQDMENTLLEMSTGNKKLSFKVKNVFVSKDSIIK